MRDVSAGDGHVFVANSDDGLVVVDVSDPSSIKQTSVLEFDKPVNRVILDGKRLLLGNDADGLKIVDISNPLKPTRVGMSADE